MTHTWNDFYDGQDPPLGPQLPLTSGQQAQNVSGVLPSGESNFFDLQQDRQRNLGSGINKNYDYAKEAAGSGILATYPQDPFFSVSTHNPHKDDKPSGLIDRYYESGIFHFSGIGSGNPPASNKYGVVTYPTYPLNSGSIFSSGYYIPSGFDARFQKYIRPQEPRPREEEPRPDWAFRVMDSYIHHKAWPSMKELTGSDYAEIKFIDDYAVALEYSRYDVYKPNNNGYFDAGFKP